MKYFTLFSLAAFIWGCSSTYHQNYFPSKDKYADFVNEEIDDEELVITLSGDSIIHTEEGGKIISDSELQFLKIQNKSIPLNEVKKISYSDSYTAILSGFLIGAASGAAIGGFTEIIPANETRPSFTPPYQRTEYNKFNSFLIGTVSGAVIGTVLGWIMGSNFVFYFD